ncbi:MAG: AGE family epimerase/isomerase [Leadbetterella sp.]|nr:AGE family epimerase/isomerase [Leadbetterella sp.]
MDLSVFIQEIRNERDAILDFWTKNSLDLVNGGFIGKLDFSGKKHYSSIKGGVLNARILWTFSSACVATGNSIYKEIADNAFEYMKKHLIDHVNGGTYWSLDTSGNKLDGRKQIYGLAFAIYGFSEYYKIYKNSEALDLAKKLYFEIEKHSFDHKSNGYFEAFAEDWSALSDMRLSDKDLNATKTMNTHLHILEAYTNLYAIFPDKQLADKIENLLEIFDEKIIDSTLGQLNLFFDDDWNSLSKRYSFGHDIEASWLLLDSALAIQKNEITEKWKNKAIQISEIILKNINPDGSLYHEIDLGNMHIDKHREWWVSAEAMVGFLNAYQLSNENKYLDAVFGLWDFIKKHIKDTQNGEWHWGVLDNYSKMEEDKIGFWKCPYHNYRACQEILKRL